MTSDQIYDALCRTIPGGVNSPFRAFHLVGGKSRVLVRGQGSRVWDVDGREYIDLCCGWGPLTLGHAHPTVVKAVQEAALDGVLFGAPTPWELEMATLLRGFLPTLEMVRFVNSGAEAVQSALRVARSVTRRVKVIKFEGGYHGHVPPLDAAGLEAEEAGGALALGATPGTVEDTLLATYNDLDSVAQLFRDYPAQIACVAVEPVTGSMGVVAARDDFVSGLRELCDRHGSLLLFDEVLTGFRVGPAAQLNYSVTPDLTCLGKALAGGLPVGAYGGRKELMEQLSPLGPIYQAGTFAGNPVTMRAGIAALQEYRREGLFEELEAKTQYLCAKLQQLFPDAVLGQVGGMFSIGFGVTELRDHRDAHRLDLKAFARFFHRALEAGVYFPPSCWDAAAISVAHTYEDLDEVARRLR